MFIEPNLPVICDHGSQLTIRGKMTFVTPEERYMHVDIAAWPTHRVKFLEQGKLLFVGTGQEACEFILKRDTEYTIDARRPGWLRPTGKALLRWYEFVQEGAYDGQDN